MPRISKAPIGKNLDSELRENFSYLISSLISAKDIEGFFGNFLTKEEKLMLGKRLVLHLMLEKGYKTNEIGSSLGMSRETVRIHKLIWQNGDSSYKKTLKRILKQQSIREFFKKLDNLVKPLDLAFKARNDMRARAKLASGDF